ncbi:MAG: hypothetical protein C4539_14685 [Ignavibacteriales bacterium]|nr:MAG: hypothetical protein C4539_14685 [Ignavibacteriales bacterium]
MKIHYYMLCYRFEALVASHLEPEAFGIYMAVGTQKNTRGNVLFFEIDPNLASDYFRLNDIDKRCTPHPDGSPKRSKYISIYRVMEHISLEAFGKLYCVTADGRVLELNPVNYDLSAEENGPNLYQELCPVAPQVVSALAPAEFTKFMTNTSNPVSVPKIFFVDMLLDRDDSGKLKGYLPYQDPQHIVDCINELKTHSGKQTKTVTRTPSFRAFFRTIRRGFFLGDQSGLKFYKFPERRELEVEYSKWWRSASESLIS